MQGTLLQILETVLGLDSTIFRECKGIFIASRFSDIHGQFTVVLTALPVILLEWERCRCEQSRLPDDCRQKECSCGAASSAYWNN